MYRDAELNGCVWVSLEVNTVPAAGSVGDL